MRLQNDVIALTTGNALFGWGTNGNGELGLGDVVARSSPVQIGALTTWAALSSSGPASFSGVLQG